MFEQLLMVGDDEDAHLLPANSGDAFAGQANGVGIETAVGFVKNGEGRLEHGELKDFSPLHLAP